MRGTVKTIRKLFEAIQRRSKKKYNSEKLLQFYIDAKKMANYEGSAEN